MHSCGVALKISLDALYGIIKWKFKYIKINLPFYRVLSSILKHLLLVFYTFSALGSFLKIKVNYM